MLFTIVFCIIAAFFALLCLGTSLYFFAEKQISTGLINLIFAVIIIIGIVILFL